MHGGPDGAWSESRAQAVFFLDFANFCKRELNSVHTGLQVSFGRDTKQCLTLVFFRGTKLWPFTLPISFNNLNCHYTPKSDFYLSFHDIPRVIAEVESLGPDNDEMRMLVQSACLVRLTNRQLSKKGLPQDFILMALYLADPSNAKRYLLFQDEHHDLDGPEVPVCSCNVH